ncbi:MAG TPA: hypothetical protein VKB38_24200 [Terracidiphilus sp.]|nr:hypothetical protein [Terracidiphilus sp.]
MGEPEHFREDVYVRENYHADPTPIDSVGSPGPQRSFDAREPMGRLTGSPLPMGGNSPASREVPVHKPAMPPGRALSTSAPEDSAMQRAVGMFKQAMPFFQRLLPLLDGNIATAVANFLAARPHSPAPAPNVDLAPVRNQISDLQAQHNDLRSTVQEQTTGLKRVEDQLEMVREATDRNTLEQQELIEDLKAMGNKVNMFAVLLSTLLVLSVVLNVVLYLHIKRVLP